MYGKHLGHCFNVWETFWDTVLILRRVEDTKGVIKFRKSKKDRQHNGQEKK